MIGGVAALSAAAIAVTPVTADPSVVSAEYRAVQLAAYTPSAVVTDTPAAVYGGLFNNTFNNISAVGTAFAANPFPLAAQILENQQGYLKRFTDALEAWPAGVNAAFAQTGNVGPHIKKMQEAIAAGEIFTAYQEYNAASLYAALAIVTPFTNLLLSRTPRGETTPVLGIPEAIAQNFADAIGVLFSATALQSGIFYASFSAFSGTLYEAARVVDVVYKAVQAGDFARAGNALVNTPGVLLNAFLNGFDYSDTDNIVSWPGLLAPLGDLNPANGTPRHSGGLLYQLLFGLPKSIADAIDNTPEVAVTPPAPVVTPPVAPQDEVASILPSTASLVSLKLDTVTGTDATVVEDVTSETPVAPVADAPEATPVDEATEAPAPADDAAGSETGTESGTDVGTDDASGTAADSSASDATKPESTPESAPETKADSKADSKSETKTDAKKGAKSDTKKGAKSDTKADSKSDAKPTESKSGNKFTPKTKAGAAAGTSTGGSSTAADSSETGSAAGDTTTGGSSAADSSSAGTGSAGSSAGSDD